jgi:2-methylaconitate cis-trans-isomerase PrpF
MASSESPDEVVMEPSLHHDCGGLAFQARAESPLRGEERIMMRSLVFLMTTSAIGVGCAASVPALSQHLADAQSAERSAAELGAASHPAAQLHLQLAHEQIGTASAAIRNGDDESADRMLARARSDAELAIALTREDGAIAASQKASTQSSEQRSTNANQGAQP